MLKRLTAPALRLPAAFTGSPLPGFVLAAAVVLVLPHFLADYWVFLCTAGLLTAVVAMGLAIIVGWVGEVTLAAAGLLGTSVYVTGYLYRFGDSNWNEWPFIPAAVGGILCAATLSGLLAIPTARFSGIYVMVLTLGLQITLERTLFSFPWIIGGFGRNVEVPRPSFFGLTFDSDISFFYLTATVAMVTALFVHALRRSRHGRAMNLVRTDARAAAAVGISPWRYKIVAFFIGGALIGLAGAFTAPLYRSPPAIVQFVAFQSLFLLAIPVVAGTQTLIGIAGTALAFALIPTALESHNLSPFLLGGAGLVLGTLVGPRGMGGVVLELFQKQKELAILGSPDDAEPPPPAERVPAEATTGTPALAMDGPIAGGMAER